ncbi:hypothetical protein KAI78_06810 [bacterium]|nr:hypothetical protein [bacterium]
MNTYLTLLIILPVFAAFLMYFFRKADNWVNIAIMSFVTLFGTVSSLVMLFSQGMEVVALGGWKPPYGIVLVGDQLSLIFVALIYLIAYLIAQFGGIERTKTNDHKSGALFMLLTAAAAGMILTGDLFNFFVFMELAAISSYVLIAKGGCRSSYTGALKYIFTGGLASMLMLLGIGILYNTTGTLNIAHLMVRIGLVGDSLRWLALGLVLCGILLKMEVFPFNLWVPESYKGAPAGMKIVLGSILSTVGGYALIRLYPILIQNPGLIKMLLPLALLSLILAELAAYREKHINRLLGYSSAGQMALVMLAILFGGRIGIYAAIFIVIAHAMAKAVLFFVGAHFKESTGSSMWESYRGLSKISPIGAALFTIAALSLTGIPGMMGFWGKLSMIGAGLASAKYFSIAIILIITIVEGVYFLRISGTLYQSTESDVKAKASYLLIPAVILVLIIVLVGFWPGCISKIINGGVSAAERSSEYAKLVLDYLL